MKKLIMLIVLIICTMSMVGCAKAVTSISSTDGSVIVGKESLGVTEHSGSTAKTIIDGVGTIDYYICDTMDDCVHNIGDVYVEDMTDYKKGKYYTMYLETEIYMYVPYGKQFIESHMVLDTVGTMSITNAVDTMYNESLKLKLSSEFATATFNSIVDVDILDKEFHVRKDEVVLPGVLRVKVDDGSMVGTEHVTINEVAVAKLTNTKYDFYFYNGVVVQAAIGTDVSSIITLH